MNNFIKLKNRINMKTFKTIKEPRKEPLDLDEPVINTRNGKLSYNSICGIYSVETDIRNVHTPQDVQEAIRKIGYLIQKAYWERVYATEMEWKGEVTFWNATISTLGDGLKAVSEINISLGIEAKMLRMGGE